MPATKKTDHYRTLGVSRTADEKEIRQAFRKKARKYHPDLNKDDASAEAKFKEVNEAHEVLSDAESRRKYDRYGDDWKNADQFEANFGRGRRRTNRRASGGDPFGRSPFGDIGDMFDSGRSPAPPAPSKVETSVDVTLEEAFAGTSRILTLTSGGQTRRIEVDIPPGVDNGSVVKIKPDAEIEAHIKVTVEPHKRFTRKGADLYLDLNVPLEDAALGGEATVSTMTGGVKLTVPRQSQNGQRIRLAGKGMPKRGSPEAHGNLYVVIRPQMPTPLGDQEREIFEQLRELRTAKE